jgi:F0F1-type ATP synthase assembly protein I
MKPPDFQPAIDIAIQLVRFFIDLFLGIIKSIPSLPIKLKGILIGMLVLGFIFGLFRIRRTRQNVEDLIERIVDILNR